MSRARVSCGGYLLLEVLAYLGIVMLIMLAIMGVVTSVRRGLVQKALHERQTEEWSAAAEFIRDDLRRARSVKWNAETDGSRSLRVALADGTAAEYLTTDGTLLRSVRRGEKVLQQRLFKVDALLTQLQRSRAGASRVWDLASVEHGSDVDATKGAVFFMLTCELRLPGGAPRTVLAGATTRAE